MDGALRGADPPLDAEHLRPGVSGEPGSPHHGDLALARVAVHIERPVQLDRWRDRIDRSIAGDGHPSGLLLEALEDERHVGPRRFEDHPAGHRLVFGQIADLELGVLVLDPGVVAEGVASAVGIGEVCTHRAVAHGARHRFELHLHRQVRVARGYLASGDRVHPLRVQHGDQADAVGVEELGGLTHLHGGRHPGTRISTVPGDLPRRIAGALLVRNRRCCGGRRVVRPGGLRAGRRRRNLDRGRVAAGHEPDGRQHQAERDRTDHRPAAEFRALPAFGDADLGSGSGVGTIGRASCRIPLCRARVLGGRRGVAGCVLARLPALHRPISGRWRKVRTGVLVWSLPGLLVHRPSLLCP